MRPQKSANLLVAYELYLQVHQLKPLSHYVDVQAVFPLRPEILAWIYMDVRIDDVNFNEIEVIIQESLVKLTIRLRICNYSMANYFLNKLAVLIS